MSVEPDPLAAQIVRWRENVLDLDLVVDECRRTVDRDIDSLRAAVRERDRADQHLAQLVALATEQQVSFHE